MGKAATVTKSGRPATYQNRLSERIRSGLIVNRLERTALGEDEMTSNEIAAARILLNKTIPDLKPLEPDRGNDSNIKDITNHQLLSVIEGRAERK